MITEIKVNGDNFVSGILFFETAKFEKLNLLFGSNGSGKSTILRSILNAANKQYSWKFGNSIAVTRDDTHSSIYSYFNGSDNPGKTELDPDSDLFDIKVFDKFNVGELSEGESILYGLHGLFSLLLNTTEDEGIPIIEGRDNIVLLDEIDSGLSIDHVDNICKIIKKILKFRNDVQFFIAFNNYHFIRTFKRVFSVYTGEFIEISSYEEYYKYIMDNRKMLNSRRDKTHNFSMKFVDPQKLKTNSTFSLRRDAEY